MPRGDFFNPWDARVQKAMFEADERRRREIAGERVEAFQVPAPARSEQEPEVAEATKPTAPKIQVLTRPRVANKLNERGLACKVCGLVTENIRSDGVSMPRHLPAKPGAKLYRDTEYCDGQGREGVAQ